MRPRLDFIERQVGQDRAHHARRHKLGRKAAMAHAVRDVVVRHHDCRHTTEVEFTQSRPDRGRGSTRVERLRRRLLDDGPVHDRVGERQADLDRVGPTCRYGLHVPLPSG